jgi:membrane protein YdbS with pleckstrin-like domain
MEGASASAPPTPAEKIRAAQPAGATQSEPEQELWRGSYSPKAMYGSWAMAIIVTLAAIVLAVLVPNPAAWIAVAIAVPLLWLALLLTLVYRRLSIEYTLTTQKLVHKKGILRRQTNRIELIDIDDVTSDQGLFDRMFGVGTVKLLSSDVSDPTFVLVGIDNVLQVANLIDNARRDERRKRAVYMEKV